jgi:hypothetical protein
MMALDSLKRHDSATANNILAALVLSSTTNPGVGEAAEAAEAYHNEQAEVLKELREKLHVPPDEQSAEITSKLLTLLQRQIHEIALGGKDIGAVLARAGQAGRLPTSLYEVSYAPQFSHCIDLGTKVAHVQDAILRPNEVQHLSGNEQDPEFSLFLKFQANTKQAAPYWLSVFAQRQGRTLIVQNAWRVYLSDVDLTNAKKPIDVLSAFANEFGFEILVGSQVGKFIVDETISLPDQQMIRAYTLKGVLGKQYLATMSGKNVPGAHRVVVAYAIDLTRYEESLRRHRVRTSLKPNPSLRDDVTILVSAPTDQSVRFTFV